MTKQRGSDQSTGRAQGPSGHMVRRAGVAAAATALLGASSMWAAAPASATAPSRPRSSGVFRNPRTGLRPGVTPLGTSGSPPKRASAPAGAHLTYYGGRVISNVQVIQVLYGSGSYESHVQTTATPSLASFYQQATNSSFFDLLSEYHTSGLPSPTTNQFIGHGSFSQQVAITPSSVNNGTTIADTQIQAELAQQIQAGHVPAPTHDAAGNDNTYYALFFPHGKTITQGGSSSCVAGGFAAYHGTVANVSGYGEIYYGVQPDFQAGSGCDFGTGSGTTFQNEMSVASHELAEATTDAEVGLATTLMPPVAWYDSTNGEIGDICNSQEAPLAGADGQTYTVQKLFSNSQNDCVSGGPPLTSDFTLGSSPSSLAVSQGSAGAASATITSGAVGPPETVSLSLSGLPHGATASLNPVSITSGGSSALKVKAGTAQAGSYTLTVTGAASSGSHTTTVGLTIKPIGQGGIVNGGFEGGLTGWKPKGAVSLSATANSGTHSAMLGSANPTLTSSLTQTFTAPVTGGTFELNLYYQVHCPDVVTHDWALAQLKDNTMKTSTFVLSKTCTNTGAWVPTAGVVLVAGDNYTLLLENHDNNVVGDATYTLFDDVTLTSVGMVNGGFETGTLSAWTPSGSSSSETVVSSGCHSGTYCAMLGATTPTMGDSTISQTFTATPGKAQLALWFEMFCPDTVTYDWATVSLVDNTTSSTATLLPKTCNGSAAWTNVTGAIIAGHNYTLQLTSHDDNSAGDPTYTLYDDVTLQ